MTQRKVAPHVYLVAGDNIGDSPVDHLRVTSAADHSNDSCQADTAGTADIYKEDHSHSTSRATKLSCIQQDHSYNLASPRSLKQKHQATEKISKYVQEEAENAMPKVQGVYSKSFIVLRVPSEETLRKFVEL